MFKFITFIAIVIGLCCLIPQEVFSQTIMLTMNPRNQYVSGGIGIGTIIAIIASWSRNSSILWAILHGFLGWLYVIYFVITR
ncbi:MAG: hypothetical protein KA198_09275 [Chitinophagaceae bacterium]|nr:hypothetical protein [Chitinophagaceae bacterium]